MPTTAEVRLWGRRIGAVSLLDDDEFASFEYDPRFARTDIQVAPFMMPLEGGPFRFPGLNPETFRGLPGMLADSLPDRFGNALINSWLAQQGQSPESFNAVERLCYIGTRGMGALEYAPPAGPTFDQSTDLHIGKLVELASLALSSREAVAGSLVGDEREQAMADLLRVGTSAGGARAKAVIAWNPTTNAIRSGQVKADEGFEYWLLKFDGVHDSSPTTLQTAQGYGAIEFAYSQMARKADIDMPPTRLLEENGRRHFMVKRFDRDDEGNKLHMQSLAALQHMDFNQPEANSYEQALLTIQELGRRVPTSTRLQMPTVEQQFRRMVFNIVARNQDDHVKNISFLMNQNGQWRLSPAFDVAWAYKPSSKWVSRHQMSVNDKRDDFTVEDLRRCAKTAAMAVGRVEEILSEVTATVRSWPKFAHAAGVEPSRIEEIGDTHRLDLPPR